MTNSMDSIKFLRVIVGRYFKCFRKPIFFSKLFWVAVVMEYPTHPLSHVELLYIR